MNGRGRWLWIGIGVVGVLWNMAALAQPLSDMEWDRFQEMTNAGREGRTHIDPFASGSTGADGLLIEELQLTGIVYANEGDAYALISGYLIRPGDRIAGYRVDAINRESVRLRRIDDIFVLNLGGGI